ncbi:MAG: O-antigen ligase family protein [Pseudomonadota bacterium]
MTPRFRHVEFAIALFGLAFMSGTLTMVLTQPNSLSSPMVQVVGAAIGFFAVLSIWLERGAVNRVVSTYKLALLPVAFAIISLIWTVDFGVTLRRAGALGLTTAFGLWLAMRFTPKQLFMLVSVLTAIIIVANFLVIQFIPSRGIHQTTDLLTAHHAGSWRGMLAHKNDFGRMMAFVFCLLVVAFMFRVGGRLGRFVALPLFGMAGMMIVYSNSAQAVLLFVLVPLVLVQMLSMSKVSSTTRALLLVLVAPAVVIVAMSAQAVMTWGLGLVGRDPTLTGRTEIWESTLIGLQDIAFAGGGYGAGWEVVAARMTALLGAAPAHAHNGYLDLAADIGFFGLGLVLAVMIWNTITSFRNLMQGVLPEISTLALTVLIFSFIGNIAGSFLLQFNSIYWVLIVATYCQLVDAKRESRSSYRPVNFANGPYEAKQWVT